MLKPDAPSLIKVPSGDDDRAHSIIRLGDVTRVVLMLTPRPEGSLAEQAAEILDAMRAALRGHESPMLVPTQTVFLRDSADQAACEKLFAASELLAATVTHFVVQPPCSGARLAVEAWAIGGTGVTVERRSAQSVTVTYDGIQWLYTGGVKPLVGEACVHGQALDVFQQTHELLGAASLGWKHVVRAWWQLEGLTALQGHTQRYLELNRARAEVFAGIDFGNARLSAVAHHLGYPASTGIGMKAGSGLTLTVVAMETRRRDVTLVPIENPLQTPAYAYAKHYSPQSPKFSRAMAMVLPNYVTTWVSGTASILDSEVRHVGNIVAQTEQTLDNIAALISPQNFSRHGLPDAGASLCDLAKVRVYVKRAADYAACRAVCERRLGSVPAIYVVADVCRPELLVEIEGVAFSRRATRGEGAEVSK